MRARAVKRCALFTVTLAVMGCGSDPQPQLCKALGVGDLVISEFLADPAGSDTGNEWIEIYNPTGRDISLEGVSVYVSAVDGTASKTHVIRVGTIASQGYFTIGDVRGTDALPPFIGYSYGDALGALSNTEGILGFKCSQRVIDEVQYTVTATPAHARQFDGNLNPDPGANDDETHWCDADQSIPGTMNYGTPGAANTMCGPVVRAGNCIELPSGIVRPVVPPLPGRVFFTEVMSDPKAVSDTSGEWIELHATADVDLNDTVLTVGSSNHTLSATECLHMGSGDYALLAKDTNAGVNGGLPPVLATFTQSLTNTGGTLTLSLDDAGIDFATYGASTSGVALQLDPDKLDATSNDDPTRFCNATVSFTGLDGGDLGTPAAANTACGAVVNPNQCLDPVTNQLRPVVRPTAGQVFFTEVMADPKAVADTSGEWLELLASADVDLNGTVFSVGTSSRVLSAPSCLHMASGSYAVLAHATDAGTNGGLPNVLATFTQALGNSGGTVSLSADDAGVDTAVYGAAVSGIAWQLDPLQLDAVSNDNPTSFCRATVAYGAGDLGTPGAANTACPVPVNPDQCIDPVSSQMRAIVRPSAGDLVISEFMSDPAAVSDSVGEYIEVLANNAVDLNGVVLGFDTSRSIVTSQTCLAVTAGSYSVFAPSADSQVNGGLPPVAGTFSFGLTNSGLHTLSLLSNDGGVLDTLLYGPDAGRVATGASTQLKSGLSAPADNDVAANLCVTSAASVYGPMSDAGVGDRGTPGLPNETCP
jgi:hypothetical protein